jgi:hypothetical protein
MREQEPGHGIDRNAGRRGNRLGVSRVSDRCSEFSCDTTTEKIVENWSIFVILGKTAQVWLQKSNGFFFGKSELI